MNGSLQTHIEEASSEREEALLTRRKENIETFIKHLSQEEKMILVYQYGESLTRKNTALKVNKCVNAVSQKQKKMITTLSRWLEFEEGYETNGKV